ncbi:accessory factor associated with RNA polymerase II [Ophidiomyces ophidiicola]|nr:accessory factor associated with RNA polymerase II [Ophidiomyces ophidiicola]KAI1977941.1 accessory factor associated with RNA polymerase II [Ophidiomyces ophidiicola]KAI1984710.1 accessory factor associated with RNA polymerase II [Ophidiomyces ophidiicola]KAI2003298.1 accessory factor associated with RNA polymerase II [Ophidiomyces ophidiicola]
MATTDPSLSDPLLALRRALTFGTPPTLTTSADLSTENVTEDLIEATHLYVTQPIPQALSLSTPTRFVSAAAHQHAIDLRSIYFAWLKKDVAIPEYISSAQELNDALKKKQEESGLAETLKIENLVFVERLDLITWLEGASEESEYIKPLEGVGVAGAQPAAGAAAGGGAVAGGSAAPAAKAQAAAHVGGRPVKVIDARLQQIYNGERKLGDRNSVLRGIRPTDFSHVRKTAEKFLGRGRAGAAPYTSGGAKPGAKSAIPTPVRGLIPKKSMDPSSSRRPNPIILVSPSASSLLRMSNIKAFLEEGTYIPPDHPTLSRSTGANRLKISRALHSVHDSSSAGGHKPSTSRSGTVFILVDSTADFKPEYWNNVVAVFTTGQTWQFKSYKWSSPPDLFKHATGVYVGWRGEDVPRDVKGWGRGVRTFALERWDEKSSGPNAIGGRTRWRDREVVEGIWGAIEEGMRARGWGSK